MLSSDVVSPRAANTMRGCSVFVLLDVGLFFSRPQEHTWQTRPKERTTRPTLTQPSSTLKATMHTQKKRKNTSFRLQRELSGSFPFPLWVSVSLFLCLPFFFSTCDPCPHHDNEEPAGCPLAEKFPERFPIIAFVEPISVVPVFSFISFLFLFWQPVSTGSLPLLPMRSPLSYFFLFFDILEICTSTMTASYMTLPCSCSPLFPANQTPEHILCPLCSHMPTNTYHKSHQHGA